MHLSKQINKSINITKEKNKRLKLTNEDYVSVLKNKFPNVYGESEIATISKSWTANQETTFRLIKNRIGSEEAEIFQLMAKYLRTVDNRNQESE